MPWMISPPRKMAVTVLPGMPIVKSGISEPPMTALLAVSDAIMPSTMPVPNFSGYLEAFLADE